MLLPFSWIAVHVSGHINIYDIHLLDNISECQMAEGGERQINIKFDKPV